MKNDDPIIVVETIETLALGSEGHVAAKFSVSPGDPIALSSVCLDGSASYCGTGDDIVEYIWDFGHERIVRNKAPVAQHNFQQAGNFEVSLTVKTAAGLRAEIRKALRVGFRLKLEHEPRCPLVSRPVRIVANAFVNLDAEDGIVQFAWDLNGDGSYDCFSTDGELHHVYERSGDYTIGVRATNVNGITEATTRSLSVVEMTGF